jgi:hypothetical protein
MFAFVPPDGKPELTGDMISKVEEFGDTQNKDSDALGQCIGHTNDK